MMSSLRRLSQYNQGSLDTLQHYTGTQDVILVMEIYSIQSLEVERFTVVTFTSWCRCDVHLKHSVVKLDCTLLDHIPFSPSMYVWAAHLESVWVGSFDCMRSA